jgi:hypothetical protein
MPRIIAASRLPSAPGTGMNDRKLFIHAVSLFHYNTKDKTYE